MQQRGREIARGDGWEAEEAAAEHDPEGTERGQLHLCEL